ncbi:MAG: adenine phosphoribosyltransferase [Spirochaetales bacterium]
MKYDALLDKAIRKVPNFPHEGVLFYDITGILGNPEAFRHVNQALAKLYAGKGLAGIAVVESRGFVFGAPLADSLGVPLILVRKKGKLPGKTLARSYALEYGEAIIEVQPQDVPPGGRLLLVDDLLATGGTLRAAAELLEAAGGVVTDLFCVVGLPFLHPERVLGDRKVETLIDYAGESL